VAGARFLNAALQPDDPVVGLVQHITGSKPTATVAVLLVQHMHLGDGTKNVEALSGDDMADPNAKVEANVVQLQSSADGAELSYTELSFAERGPEGEVQGCCCSRRCRRRRRRSSSSSTRAECSNPAGRVSDNIWVDIANNPYVGC